MAIGGGTARKTSNWLRQTRIPLSAAGGKTDDSQSGFTPPMSVFVVLLLSFKYLDLIANLHRQPDVALCVRRLRWPQRRLDHHGRRPRHCRLRALRDGVGTRCERPCGRPDTDDPLAVDVRRGQLAHDEIPIAPEKPRRFPPDLRAWVRSTRKALLAGSTSCDRRAWENSSSPLARCHRPACGRDRPLPALDNALALSPQEAVDPTQPLKFSLNSAKGRKTPAAVGCGRRVTRGIHEHVQCLHCPSSSSLLAFAIDVRRGGKECC